MKIEITCECGRIHDVGAIFAKKGGAANAKKSPRPASFYSEMNKNRKVRAGWPKGVPRKPKAIPAPPA